VRPSHIANALGLSEPEAFAAARNLHDWFNKPFSRTKNGKTREYDPPTGVGRKRLSRLANFVARELPCHSCAHGSVQKRSPFTAAAVHLGARILIKRDVKNCFPSMSPGRFEVEMRALGFSEEVCFLLTGLLLFRGRLPQGSPASNAALNLFFFRTDEAIRLAAARFGGRYTRFADDFNISISDRAFVVDAANLLEKSLAACGLETNRKKRKQEGLRLIHEERIVNGVATNSPNGTRLPAAVAARLVRNAEALLVSAKSASPGTLAGIAERRRRLEGSLNYAAMAARSPAKAMRRILSLTDDAIRSRLNKSDIKTTEVWWQKNQHHDVAEVIAARWFSKLGGNFANAPVIIGSDVVDRAIA
jgi:hypothetical protein